MSKARKKYKFKQEAVNLADKVGSTKAGADLGLHDDNPQEKQLKLDRTTFYSANSKREAQTNAILLSLVESCKLNQVNPREYFRDLVEDLHQGKESYTPYQYKKKLLEDSSKKDD